MARSVGAFMRERSVMTFGIAEPFKRRHLHEIGVDIVKAILPPCQVKRLTVAGLPWILPEPDTNPFAVECRGVSQQSFDLARVRPPTHHIEQSVAAVLMAAELGPASTTEHHSEPGRRSDLAIDT
jgi:hypothetical protein